MKAMKWVGLGAIALLSAACGNGGVRSTGSGPAATPSSGVQAELRIQGDDTKNGSMLLTLDQVEITANGQRLDLKSGDTSLLDLGNTNQAWLVGTVTIPDGVQAVHVKVSFDDFGAYQGTAGAGSVDARIPPFEFDAPAANLTLHGHAVIHVNQAESLLSIRDGEKLFLPKLKVEY